ncbi:hypothetical protein METSCH_E04140 [Metschnikowia aff. pulcherrima]|uniref:Uncharacterized protein n=1 Tax=Metschnikowia aff. pulcherrima TaxID=2163413 RepID=A0A4V1AER9_9ASCO|nr:hypothetical protein METSCH_E04140 [Metschnikowia aff. pulcherrima]
MPLDLIKSSVIEMSINATPSLVRPHLSTLIPDEHPYGSRGSFDNMHLRNESTEGSPTLKRPHVLKTKASSRLNSVRRPELRNHSSKLHLIDDTTLTSLPFPPPAASKRLKRAPLTASGISNSHGPFLHRDPLLLSLGLTNSRLDAPNLAVSAAPLEPESSRVYTDYDCADDTIEDTFEESQDPIVLVEDYMTEAHSKESVFRKKSLANIKKRIRENSLGPTHFPSFIPYGRVQMEMDGDNTQETHTPGNEDLEAIFGRIPGTEKLKYCTLCDKPLYEISSVLSSSEPKEIPQETDMSHRYHEFVCWDCIVTYEQILNEIYEAERACASKDYHVLPGKSFCGRAPNDCDTPLHDGEGHGMNTASQALKRRKFSNDLISRLQHLSEVSRPQRQIPDELMNWREKFRSNLLELLSNAFTPSEQSH